jgi:hypothetical protein
MVWRRLLTRSGSSTADHHYAIQITGGWSDLYRDGFRIHAKEYGVEDPGRHHVVRRPKESGSL